MIFIDTGIPTFRNDKTYRSLPLAQRLIHTLFLFSRYCFSFIILSMSGDLYFEWRKYIFGKNQRQPKSAVMPTTILASCVVLKNWKAGWSEGHGSFLKYRFLNILTNRNMKSAQSLPVGDDNNKVIGGGGEFAQYGRSKTSFPRCFREGRDSNH